MRSRVAGCVVLAAAVERDRVAAASIDLVVVERADADLRAGKVLQDRDRAARAAGGLAHAAARSRRAARAVPWLKFSRATSMPASTIRTSTSGSREAGPIVATIFVRRSIGTE